MIATSTTAPSPHKDKVDSPVIDGWNCSWPYLPDRSHTDSYLQCVDPTGNAIKFGDRHRTPRQPNLV